MVMKHYPAQFKADAVALYRSRPGAAIAQIADDLGVNRGDAAVLRERGEREQVVAGVVQMCCRVRESGPDRLNDAAELGPN